MTDPVAFRAGPFEIRWYGILMALSILTVVFLSLREIRRRGLDEDSFLDIVILAIPAGFVGARLYYVLFNWSYYSLNPSEIPAVWHGGLAIHGSIIGAFAAMLFVVKRQKLDFWAYVDCTVIFFPLGQAIGRWGNFFNQEAYGYPVSPEDIPWAMWIDGAYRHPTFLYESVWNLGVFLVLYLVLRKRSGMLKGDLLFFYFILYSAGRFFVEGFRTDSLMLGSMRMAQVISLVLIAVSAAVLFFRHRKGRVGS